MLESAFIAAAVLSAAALGIVAVACMYGGCSRIALASAVAAVLLFLGAALAIEQTMIVMGVAVAFAIVLLVAVGWCALGSVLLATGELCRQAGRECTASTASTPYASGVGDRPGPHRPLQGATSTR